MIRQLGMFFLVMLMSSAAIACGRVHGEGPTPEMACWQYEQNANRASQARAQCYASCKMKKVKYNAKRALYTYADSVPNHGGSCISGRYDRRRVSANEFIRRYPKPENSAPPSVTEPAPST